MKKRDVAVLGAAILAATGVAYAHSESDLKAMVCEKGVYVTEKSTKLFTFNGSEVMKTENVKELPDKKRNVLVYNMITSEGNNVLALGYVDKKITDIGMFNEVKIAKVQPGEENALEEMVRSGFGFNNFHVYKCQ